MVETVHLLMAPQLQQWERETFGVVCAMSTVVKVECCHTFRGIGCEQQLATVDKTLGHWCIQLTPADCGLYL